MKEGFQNIVFIVYSKPKILRNEKVKNMRTGYQFGFLYNGLRWLNKVQQNHRAENRAFVFSFVTND